MKIFVSYTTLDKEINKEFLLNLYCLLRPWSEVFIDLINNDSVCKQDRVLEELRTCNVLILIVSPNVWHSKWVNFELSKARSRGIPIIEISRMFLLNLMPRIIF
ncbi:TIR domain-containing protein [Terrimonas ferruginea]|uniref:TIR domain-containing protein n=1 Tax=Terrimonas ferruginea TaxID=249 RepID=UPI0008FFB9DF